ncbi:DUF3795 domain-containing protein [candidate division WOR-3 bacterium]|nr:DUF3795 domain-containing protein [candidate division WOR-3 bacterium]
MQRMIAFCGVICTECPVYIATQRNDDERRRKVAQAWSSADEPRKPEDINCYGCLIVGGKLYQYCATCEVRTCGFEKKVENCSYCDEYPCGKLNKHWEEEDVIGIERVGEEWGSKAKANLEEIKKNQ